MIDIPQSKRGHIVTDLMPDLTPLLDVMFMLIVFFILTANAVPYALDIDLPEDTEAISQAVEDPDMLSVTLLAGDAGWKINSEVFETESAFKAALEVKANKDQKVIIIGDKDASMQKLMSILAFLRKHEIEAADIVMQQK